MLVGLIAVFQSTVATMFLYRGGTPLQDRPGAQPSELWVPTVGRVGVSNIDTARSVWDSLNAAECYIGVVASLIDKHYELRPAFSYLRGRHGVPTVGFKGSIRYTTLPKAWHVYTYPKHLANNRDRKVMAGVSGFLRRHAVARIR